MGQRALNLQGHRSIDRSIDPIDLTWLVRRDSPQVSIHGINKQAHALSLSLTHPVPKA
jgi:hypothetical protein